MTRTYSLDPIRRYCAGEGFFHAAHEAIAAPSSERERRRVAHDPGSGSGGALTSVALGAAQIPDCHCGDVVVLKGEGEVELNRMLARVAGVRNIAGSDEVIATSRSLH